MGWATIRHVPRILNHQHALDWYDKITPIRGRAPEIRPLGNRRDCDTYSIRKNGDDVELVLYTTPVVTFKPSGVVVLQTCGWSSVSTHQFIYQTLGLPAHGQGGSSVITVCGQRYTMTGDNKLLLNREGTNAWRVLMSETLYGYKLNRKALTNVRSRYSQFRKYFKGFVNLRQEEVVSYANSPYEQRFNVVKFCAQEAVDMFGVEGVVDMFGVKNSVWADKKVLNRESIDCIFDKPSRIRWGSPTEKQKQEHREQVRRYQKNMGEFLKTIADGQPDEVRHDNFYRGAMAFLVEAHRARVSNPAMAWVLHDLDQEVTENVSSLMSSMDKAISIYHAEEILERVQLEAGKTPNHKYAGWISEKV